MRILRRISYQQATSSAQLPTVHASSHIL